MRGSARTAGGAEIGRVEARRQFAGEAVEIGGRARARAGLRRQPGLFGGVGTIGARRADRRHRRRLARRLQRPGALGSGAARGAASGVMRAGCSRATSRAPTARTILGSTTTSVGPPIISRCSILSRRISTRRRRPSTAAASITASRGWRPRDGAQAVGAEAAHQPGGQADQGEHDREGDEELDGQRHLRPSRSNINALRSSTPQGSGRESPEWLTPSALFAARHTNRSLTREGAFAPSRGFQGLRDGKRRPSRPYSFTRH